MAWTGKSRSLEAPMRRVHCMVFSPVEKGRGRPKTLEKVVKGDLMVNNISEDLVFNYVK